MTEFAEKLRSLSFPRKMGVTEIKPVLDERDGTVGGYHDVHWDGSQDARVLPKSLRMKLTTNDPAADAGLNKEQA